MTNRVRLRPGPHPPDVWPGGNRTANRPGRPAWATLVGLLAGVWLSPGLGLGQTDLWYSTEPITNRQGLSESCISSLYQDRTGYLWIATADGLNKYDGNRFRVYRHDPWDPTSISGSYVIFVTGDRAGRIWAGTFDSGLNRMNPHSEEFRSYRHHPDDPHSLSHNHVNWVLEDHRGTIWVATDGGGVNRLDPDTGRFTAFRHHPGRADSLSSDSTHCLFEDPAHPGRIWVGTDTGIDRLDADTGQVTRCGPATERGAALRTLVRAIVPGDGSSLLVGTNRGLYQLDTQDDHLLPVPLHPDGNGSPLLVDTIYAILAGDPARDRVFWLGTRNHGLLQYFPTSGQSRRFDLVPLGAPGLDKRMIVSLLRDHSQNIWVGSWSFWITKLIPRHFQLIQAVPDHPNSLMDNRIYHLAVGPGGEVWIADRIGLNRYDPTTGDITHYRPDPRAPGRLSSSRVGQVCVAEDGTLWAGTMNAGLNRLPPGSDRFDHFRHDPAKAESLASDAIRVLHLDQEGRLWVAHNAGEVDWLDTATGRVTRYRHSGRDPFGTGDDRVSCLAEDEAGVLWAGTQRGNLYRFDRSTSQFRRIERESDGIARHSQIYTIHFRARLGRGEVWLGTEGAGLEQVDLDTGQSRHHFIRDGFTSNIVYGLLEDPAGLFWVSSPSGITRLDPASGSHQTYVFPCGPFNNEFASQVYLHHPDGSFYFGGNLGVIRFRPEEFIRTPISPPTVAITGLNVRNQPRRFDVPLAEIEEVVLSPTENWFTLEFSVFDLTEPSSNRYTYQLAGVDPDWVDAGNRPFASYTGLEPGRYLFRVKGAGVRGEWSDRPAILRLRIDPPFWRTQWFQLLLAALVLGSALTAHFTRFRRAERRRRQLEALVAQRTRELSARNEELETLNTIIKTVNSEFDLDELTRSMLQEACSVLRLPRALALSPDPDGRYYTLRQAIGPDAPSAEAPFQPPVKCVDDLLTHSRQLLPDIYLSDNPPAGRGFEPILANLPGASLLTIFIRTGETVVSLLMFQSHPGQTFPPDLHPLMNNLKEHFRLAFTKTRLLDQLRILNQNKNQLMRVVAHDLRNPVSGIYACIKLLQEDLEQDTLQLDSWREDLALMIKTVEQMLALLNELLSHSAIESGEIPFTLQEVDLMPLIENQVGFYRRLAERKRIDVRCENPPAGLPRVTADPGRVTEVLGNLLSNAVKYTHPTGSVRIRVEWSGPEVVTHIQDTGQGICPEEQAHLFSDSRRLSPQPTGGEPSTRFGLVITKLILERMHGRIWVDSQPGVGSTFSFALPAASPGVCPPFRG